MIEFKKHFVKNGDKKCRVHYSNSCLINGKTCITLYAKSYSDNLYPVFGNLVENDTEIQSDYFEKDKVRIYPDSPLYEAALKYVRK